MELIELKNRILSSFSGSDEELLEILRIVEGDFAVFPFNEYEHLIIRLMKAGSLTFEQYLDFRTEYISKNPHLWIFEISAPRGFGERFAQTLIMEKCSKISYPSKKLDPLYSGQYDLWLDGITIEVKASRAVDSESNDPLYMKALSRKTKRPFLMNFQQLKPQYCDVFIWVAVFRDQIVLWVMSSKEVKEHPLYSSGQHRGNLGNEGQLHITHQSIKSLKKFEVKGDNIEKCIRLAAKRNRK